MAITLHTLLFLAFNVCVIDGKADDIRSSGSGIQRETLDAVGWTLHINRELIKNEPKATKQATTLLKKQLAQIVKVVPAPAVAEMQKVPLYFSPAYPDSQARAEFHPGAEWLKENGRDPAMVKSVEFTNILIFESETRRMPNFALHELSHAYHDIVLPDGFGNPQVIAAFDRAKQSGKYDRVERRNGAGKKKTFELAYGMSNPMEYFAETTEAYFTGNDFFPFTRKELEMHDLEMTQLLEQLWGVEK